jgi:hypothetical protein
VTNVALCRWAAFAPISPLLWSKSPSVSRLRYAPTACLLHFPPVSPYLTYVLGSKVLKHAAYLGCAPSGSARSQPASFCSVHALDPKVYSERPLFSRNSRFPPPSQQLWARLPSSMLPARPLLCMHSDRCEAGVRPVGKFTERPRHVIQVSSSAFIRRFLPCYFPP